MGTSGLPIKAKCSGLLGPV